MVLTRRQRVGLWLMALYFLTDLFFTMTNLELASENFIRSLLMWKGYLTGFGFKPEWLCTFLSAPYFWILTGVMISGGVAISFIMARAFVLAGWMMIAKLLFSAILYHHFWFGFEEQTGIECSLFFQSIALCGGLLVLVGERKEVYRPLSQPFTGSVMTIRPPEVDDED